MLTLCLTVYPWYTVLPLPNPGPKPVCLLHDPINAHVIRPNVANRAAGTVMSISKSYLAFESVRPATRHSRYSTITVPDDGAEEGCLSVDSRAVSTRPGPVSPRAYVPGADVVVCPDAQTGAAPSCQNRGNCGHFIPGLTCFNDCASSRD
jgi:hypothetical protein